MEPVQKYYDVLFPWLEGIQLKSDKHIYSLFRIEAVCSSQHISIADQCAATKPIDFILIFMSKSQSNHVGKFLRISRLSADNQWCITPTTIDSLVYDRRIGKEKAVSHLLLKDILLVLGASWSKKKNVS